MQQSARNSVAVVIEAIWDERTTLEQQRVLVHSMGGVLRASGVSIKEVGALIRGEAVAVGQAVEGRAPNGKVYVKAPLPEGMDDELEACLMGTALVQALKRRSKKLSPTQLSFLESLTHRFGEGRWLTTKQLNWLNQLLANAGMGELT